MKRRKCESQVRWKGAGVVGLVGRFASEQKFRSSIFNGSSNPLLLREEFI
jgi:hypothetical protein